VWFTSDFHLGHNNIRNLCSRPYQSVEEMDDNLIENVNEAAKENHELFFLGDFSLCRKDRLKRYMERIVCRKKTLIVGNHDTMRPQWYVENGWQLASPYPLVVLGSIILSHRMQPLPPESAFFNLFGHVHNHMPHRPDPRHMNVSCDVTDFRPVNLEYVLDQIKHH